jgi:hypothetical protein
MRASSFPDWIKDHTLNSLCNLTTNSIYTQDGRHCFTEGMWDVNGTIDSTGITVDVLYENAGIRSGPRSILMGTPKNLLFANVAGRFTLPPSWSGKKVSISLYTAKGELVARKTFEKTGIDIKRDFRVSRGFSIIQVRDVQ